MIHQGKLINTKNDQRLSYEFFKSQKVMDMYKVFLHPIINPQPISLKSYDKLR